jgi:hypothetical protein
MRWWRGLSIVLGAPISACFLVSFGMQIAMTGRVVTADLRPLLAISTMALLFAVPGSALLSLVFASTRDRLGLLGRLAAVLLTGLAVGAALLGVGGSPDGLKLGALYGEATAIAWVTLIVILEPDLRRRIVAGA